jgi:hypothetical protein
VVRRTLPSAGVGRRCKSAFDCVDCRDPVRLPRGERKEVEFAS